MKWTDKEVCSSLSWYFPSFIYSSFLYVITIMMFFRYKTSNWLYTDVRERGGLGSSLTRIEIDWHEVSERLRCVNRARKWYVFWFSSIASPGQIEQRTRNSKNSQHDHQTQSDFLSLSLFLIDSSCSLFASGPILFLSRLTFVSYTVVLLVYCRLTNGENPWKSS